MGSGDDSLTRDPLDSLSATKPSRMLFVWECQHGRLALNIWNSVCWYYMDQQFIFEIVVCHVASWHPLVAIWWLRDKSCVSVIIVWVKLNYVFNIFTKRLLHYEESIVSNIQIMNPIVRKVKNQHRTIRHKFQLVDLSFLYLTVMVFNDVDFL